METPSCLSSFRRCRSSSAVHSASVGPLELTPLRVRPELGSDPPSPYAHGGQQGSAAPGHRPYKGEADPAPPRWSSVVVGDRPAPRRGRVAGVLGWVVDAHATVAPSPAGQDLPFPIGAMASAVNVAPRFPADGAFVTRSCAKNRKRMSTPDKRG